MQILESDPFNSLETVMGLERELVQIAFCEAAHVPEEFAGVKLSDRGEVVRLLFEDYQRLGVTSGKVESKEWIQSIEAQARVLARPFTSNSRTSER